MNFYNKKFWIRRGSYFIAQRIGVTKNFSPSYLKSVRFLVGRCAAFMIWIEDDPSGSSYRCIYDSSCVDLNNISSKNSRTNLKRGLKRTQVREVKFCDLDKSYFETYLKSCESRQEKAKYTRDEFFANLRKFLSNDNCAIYAGFCDGRLAAYMTVINSETIAFGDVLHFDRAFGSSNPLWSLYYNVANISLAKGFLAFDRGTQPLVHSTNVDDFLVKINFKIVPIKYSSRSFPLMSSCFRILHFYVKRFPDFFSCTFRKKVFALDRILNSGF
jgi:hypothetical protein